MPIPAPSSAPLTTPERLKIAHLVFSMDAGGMENGIVNVSNRLDPARFEIHIVCLEKAGSFERRLAPHVRLHVLGREGKGVSPRLMIRLWALLRELRPALLHTHNFGTLVYGAAAALPGGIPIVHGEHGDLDPACRTPRRLFERRFLYRACRKILTVGSELERSLLPLVAGGKDQMLTIRNGVDTGRFHPGDRACARAELGLPTEGLWIGLIGRFVPVKRHREMAEAFGRLAGKWPDLQLLLVSDQRPESEAFRDTLARLPYGDRIHWRFFSDTPELFYQALDLLVAASLAEGLSNVVLEGMASGLPLLVHNDCGNAEVAGEGRYALVKDLGTPDQMAAEIHRMLEEPERMATQGEAARGHASTDLSIEAMVAAYARVYREFARGT